MSEQKWTREPWEVFDASATTAIQQAVVFKPPIINWQGFDDSDRPATERKANARRIVACVNAFSGVPDPAAFMAEVRGFLATLVDDRYDRVSGGLKDSANVLLAKMEGKGGADVAEG